MKTNIRNSTLKKRRKNGFRRKMKSKSGRALLNRTRRRKAGRGKTVPGIHRTR